MPPGAAHSPIAKTCGSEVRHCSSTSTPPRSATSRPHVAGQLRRAAGCRRRTPRPRRRRPVARPPSRQPGRPGRRRRATALGHRAGVHGDAELLDVPHQRGAAGVVELHRHQPRRHLDDVGLQAELDQRVGRLQAEQPAADHDAAGRRGRGRRGSPRGPRWCGRRSSRPGRGPATGGTNGAAPVASTSASYVDAPRPSAEERRSRRRPRSTRRSTGVSSTSRTRGSSYSPVGQQRQRVGAPTREEAT